MSADSLTYLTRRRAGPRPTTTSTNPHAQLTQNAPRNLQERVFSFASSLAGVVVGPSAVSVPGARAFHLPAVSEGAPGAFMIGSEFAHLHPERDGSLHLTLPPAEVDQVIENGWAERHPLAGRYGLPTNIVMIYGPRDTDELEVVEDLVRVSHRYASVAQVARQYSAAAEHRQRLEVMMPKKANQGLLEVLLDSWDRSNTILLNLLHALPEGALSVRVMEGSPSVAELFTHIHSVRLAFVSEDAPEFAKDLPVEEWVDERDPARIEQLLNESAQAVRDAVKSKVEARQDMNQHYDHPILMLQHMIWHEGYHHGQIKLSLKVTGRPISDKAVGRVTWGVWMLKT